jgi:hypothetical protein
MEKTLSLVDSSNLRVMHFYLIPQASIISRTSPFNAPVTEVSWIYFPESVDVKLYQATYESCRTTAAELTPFQGMQGGWVVEATELPGTKGERGKLFLDFRGQASTAEHVNLANESNVEDSLRSALLKGSQSRSTVHVPFLLTASSQWHVS